VEAVGVAAPGEEYNGQIFRDIREMGARVKAFVMGVLKPAPRYLGEPISLVGSGDVTNDAAFTATAG
jgi:vancomycin permeability regulator SanA